MANHSEGRLPWGVDAALMDLFAREAMRAAFAGYYVPEDESEPSGLEFKQSVAGYGESATLVWSEGPRHVESRHSLNGLDDVAQTLEFEALCSCFGAATAFDDGPYRLDRPGRFKLLGKRVFGGGLVPEENEGGQRPTLWFLSPEQSEVAKSMIDPVFFNPPPFTEHDAYLLLKESDILPWGEKMDWAAAVERAYPLGAGLNAPKASSALLPSAALGLPCPAAALAKASQTGLERALSVALAWSNGPCAKQIHERLIEVSKDPEASEAKARALCEGFHAKRAKVERGRAPNLDDSLASAALFEALALSRQTAKPTAAKPKRMGL